MGRVLERSGFAVTIFCRNLAPNAQPYAAYLSSLGKSIRVIYSEEEFCAALDDGRRRCVFIDLLPEGGYQSLVPYLRRAADAGSVLVCFDEFYQDLLEFDVTVRPFHENPQGPRNTLAGLRYYVFPEALGEASLTKQPLREVRNVLVSMGGSDPHGVSAPIAQQLAQRHPSLQFTVVVGPGFSPDHRLQLQALAGSLGNLKCAIQPDTLAPLYLANDVAITSGGLTKFETALFGLPSLILANNDQEARLMERFCAMGTAAYAGRAQDLAQLQLHRQFGAFVADQGRLVEMSRVGRATVDTHGGERVIEYIRQNAS